jgi:hypothetical protein
MEDLMDGKAMSRSSADAGTRPARRPYHSPRIVAFGSLRVLTRGQGSANTDGSSGMGLPPVGAKKLM